MQYSIELKNVCKTYPGFALKNVSFQLPKGSIMGFIGMNGAGKSTTMKSILNMVRPQSGEITVLGLDPAKNEEEIKQNIGVVFDESHFPSNFKAKQVDMVMGNLYTNWDREQFFGYIRRFSLPENKTLKEFSRGMKMKMNIAAALSHKARLLILDEPTSGLDPIVRNEILDLFMEYIQDEENSVLVSSHITGDLEKIADYITFIHNGEVILSDSKDNLVYNHGVVKGSKEEIAAIAPNYVMALRHNRFDTEALVKNKAEFAAAYPSLVVDHATLEDFMVFLAQKQAPNAR